MGISIGRLANYILSPYVDGVTASRLNLSVTEGNKISLQDVYLKSEVLNKLTIRSIFDVFYGYIGSIEIAIPWRTALDFIARGSSTTPISAKISNIYILAVPNWRGIYSAEDQARYEWEMKKRLLDQFEVLRRQMLEEYLEKKPAGRYDNLVPSLLKYAQVTISNVHLCFEDYSMLKSKLFHAGVICSKLEVTNETNEKKPSAKEEEHVVQKKIKMEAFAVYLDSKEVVQLCGCGLYAEHLNAALALKTSNKDNPLSASTEYILCPGELTVSATLNKRPDKCKRPLLDVKMDLPKLDLQLTNHQVTTLHCLAEALDRIYCHLTYLKWRPAVSIQRNPQAWWQFMFEAETQTGIGRQKEERSWEKIEETCEKIKKYQEMFKQKLLDKKVDAAMMEQYERELHLTTLMVARKLAERQVKKELIESLKKKPKEETKKTGYFAGLLSWFSSSTSRDDRQLESLKTDLDSVEESLRQPTDSMKSLAPFQKYPKNFITQQVTLLISQLKVAIKKETQTLLDVQLKQLAIELTRRESAENTLAQCTLGKAMIRGCNGVKILRHQVKMAPLLVFTFEKNPLDQECAFAVKVATKETVWLFDVETIKQLALMLMPPKGLATKMQAAATKTMYDMTTGIEKALEKKQKQLKLTVKLEPSFFVIPQVAVTVILSFGECTITTEMLDKDCAKDILKKLKTKRQNLEAAKPLIYQKYDCQLNNVQLVLSDTAKWLEDMKQFDTERHLILPFDVTVDFCRSVVPDVVHFPKMLLTAKIRQIQVKASDTQVVQLLDLIKSFPSGLATLIPADDIGNSKTTRILKSTADVSDAYNVAYEEDDDNSDTSSTTSDNTVTEADTEPQHPPCKFALENLDLDLYLDSRQVDSMFAKVCLDGLSAQGDIFCEGETIIEVGNLRVTDSRTSRKKGIRKIFEKSYEPSEDNKDKSKLLKVVIRQAPKDSRRLIFVNMASTIVTLAPDYIVPFQQFAMATVAKTTAEKSAAKSKSPLGLVFAVREIRIAKTQVIMMQSLEMSDALVGVLGCSVDFKVEEKGGEAGCQLGVHFGIGNYLRYRQFGRLEEYLLEPTKTEISLKFNELKRSFCIVSKDAVVISISPDLIGVLLTLNSLVSAANSSGPVTNTTNDHFEPKKLDPNVWYLKTPEEWLPKCETAAPIEIFDLIIEKMQVQVQVKPRCFGAQALLRLDVSLVRLQLNSQLREFELYFTAHYYSTLVGDWEPLVERPSGPGDKQHFVVKGSLTGTPPYLWLKAKSKLEILITKSFLRTLNAVIEDFQATDTTTTAAAAASRSFKFKRLIIRNSLDVPLNFEVSTSKDGGQVEVPTDCRDLKTYLWPGKEHSPLAFNPSKTILLVNQKYIGTQNYRQLHLKDARNSIRSLLCHNTKKDLKSAKYLWIERVTDSELSLTVEYSSNVQIVNHFDTPFDLYNRNEQATKFLGTVPALGRFSLSLYQVYSNGRPIFFQPSKGYQLQSILHTEILKKYCTETTIETTGLKKTVDHLKKHFLKAIPYLEISCQHETEKNQVFKLLVQGEKQMVPSERVRGSTKSTSFLLSIKLIPIAKMRNLLPYEVEFGYRLPMKEMSFTLKPGEEKILPFVDLEKELSINVTIPKYFGTKKASGIVEFPKLSKQPSTETKTIYFEFDVVSTGHKFKLPVKYCPEDGTMVMTIYATFWIFNETRLPFTLFTKYIKENRKTKGCKEFRGLQVTPANQSAASQSTKPFLAGFEEEEKIETMALKLHAFDTSAYFKVIPAYTKLSVKYDENTPEINRVKGFGTIQVCVAIEAAPFALTKILRISSFYKLYNFSKYNLELFGPYWENGWKENRPFESLATMDYFPSNLNAPTVAFRFASSPDSKPSSWSEISLKSSQQDMLLIDGRPIFVEVDLCKDIFKKLFDQPFITVKLHNYEYGQPAALIVNDTDQLLQYSKSGTFEPCEYDLSRLLPKRSVFTHLDVPRKPDVLTMWSDTFGSNMITLNWNSLEVEPLYVGIYYLSFWDGPQRVVLLKENKQSLDRLAKDLTTPYFTIVLTMDELGINLVDDESSRDLLYFSIRPSITWIDSSAIEETKALEDKNSEKPLVSPRKAARLEKDHQKTKTEERKLKDSNEDSWKISSHNIIDNKIMTKYLRYASPCGLSFSYNRYERSDRFEVIIYHMQMDNQVLDRADNALVLYSLLRLDEKGNAQHGPLLTLKATISRQDTVTHFEALEMTFQQRILIQVHISLFIQVSNFFNFTTEEKELTLAIERVLEEASKNYKADPKENKKSTIFVSYVTVQELRVIVFLINDQQFKELFAKFVHKFIIWWTNFTNKIRGNMLQNMRIKLADYYSSKGMTLSPIQLVTHLTDYYYNDVMDHWKDILAGEGYWNWRPLIPFKNELTAVRYPRILDNPLKCIPIEPYQSYLEEGAAKFIQLKLHYPSQFITEESYLYHIQVPEKDEMVLLTDVHLMKLIEKSKDNWFLNSGPFKWTNIKSVNKKDSLTVQLRLESKRVTEGLLVLKFCSEDHRQIFINLCIRYIEMMKKK